jgi:hypothetical protein
MNILAAVHALNSTYMFVRFDHLFTCSVIAMERQGRVSTVCYQFGPDNHADVKEGYASHYGNDKEIVL